VSRFTQNVATRLSQCADHRYSVTTEKNYFLGLLGGEGLHRNEAVARYKGRCRAIAATFATAVA